MIIFFTKKQKYINIMRKIFVQLKFKITNLKILNNIFFRFVVYTLFVKKYYC